MPKKRLDAEIRKHNREVMDAALAYRRSLRIPEVANILDCCDLTVRSLIKRKELPALPRRRGMAHPPRAPGSLHGTGLGVTDDQYDDYVKQLVAQTPPLRADQVARLSAMFDAPRQDQTPQTRDAKAS